MYNLVKLRKSLQFFLCVNPQGDTYKVMGQVKMLTVIALNFGHNETFQCTPTVCIDESLCD